VRFYIAKAHFYDRFRDILNPCQEKVVARWFEAGPEGFVGGLSADNYLAIKKPRVPPPPVICRIWSTKAP